MSHTARTRTYYWFSEIRKFFPVPRVARATTINGRGMPAEKFDEYKLQSCKLYSYSLDISYNQRKHYAMLLTPSDDGNDCYMLGVYMSKYNDELLEHEYGLCPHPGHRRHGEVVDQH